MPERVQRTVVLAAMGLLVAACEEDRGAERAAPAGPTKPVPTPAATEVDPRVEADRIFETRCQVCHGKQGKGDGPGSMTLEVKPRNYTDPEWQRSTRDEQIRDIIVRGGPPVGKDPGMPSTPELGGKPKVLDALVAKIRGFAADSDGGG